MAQYKKLKKQLKHKRQKADHMKNIVKAIQKPKIIDDEPLVKKLKYPPFKGELIRQPFVNFIKHADNPMNFHSKQFMTPIRRRLQKDTYYKENDSRILMTQKPLIHIADNDDRMMLSGIVADYKYVIKHNTIRIYLLIRDVRGCMKDRKNGNHWKTLTDHIWIDINDGATDARNHDVQIGIGDELVFYGRFNNYRGYRNDIKQEKVGVEDVVIVSGGYPNIRYESVDPVMGILKMNITFAFPIQYNHQEDYLIQWSNEREYPYAMPTFGDQMDKKVRDLYTNPYYQLMNSTNVDIYHQLKYGYYNIKDDANLVLNLAKAEKHDQDNALYWSRSIKESNDQFQVILNSSELNPRTNFNDVYERLCDKYRFRKTTHGRKPSPNTYHPNTDKKH